MDTIKRRPSLTDSVVVQLQERISNGEWPLGSRIPSEAELTSALGVSRTPVREAIRALAQLGLLESRQGDGTYVIATNDADVALQRRLENADVLQVIAVRRGLDMVAAREAAFNRQEEDIVAMTRAFDARSAAVAAKDEKSFVDADVEFHVAVAHASHNTVLIDLYPGFERHLRGAVQSGDCFGDALSVRHRELLDAIVNRDATAATISALGLLDDQERTLGDSAP